MERHLLRAEGIVQGYLSSPQSDTGPSVLMWSAAACLGQRMSHSPTCIISCPICQKAAEQPQAVNRAIPGRTSPCCSGINTQDAAIGVMRVSCVNRILKFFIMKELGSEPQARLLSIGMLGRPLMSSLHLIHEYFHLQVTTICEALVSFNPMQEDEIVDSLEEAAAAAAAGAAEQPLDGGHEDNAPMAATSPLQPPAASAQAKSDGPPDNHPSLASPCCAQPEPAPRDEVLLPNVSPDQVKSAETVSQPLHVVAERA